MPGQGIKIRSGGWLGTKHTESSAHWQQFLYPLNTLSTKLQTQKHASPALQQMCEKLSGIVYLIQCC